jgi:hypothetical protein
MWALSQATRTGAGLAAALCSRDTISGKLYERSAIIGSILVARRAGM